MSVELRADGRSYGVVTLEELDELLDELTTTRAVLVQLRAADAVLTIGIGNPHGSIALYLDSNGQPFSSRGETLGAPLGDLTFNDGRDAFEFYAHVAITPALARAAAVEFIATDGAIPTNLNWARDGAAAL